MDNINKQYAMESSLTDLYYTACLEYTRYIQTGNQLLKETAEWYFTVYKQRGGKKKELKLV